MSVEIATRRRVFAGVLALATLAGRARADDEQPYRGGPLPPNTHVEARRDQEVFDDALYSTLGTYILNIWAAGIGDLVCNGSCTDHAYDLLYLPLVGPAIAAATPGVERAGGAWQVILVADSVLQVGAAFVAAVTWLLPTKHVIVHDKTSFAITPGAPGAPLGVTVGVAAF